MATLDESTPLEGAESDLLPVRMLNEFAYCPRLFHLMHVEGRWADNVYTVEGKAAHRRVDQLDHILPDAERVEPDPAVDGDGDQPPVITRSVPLESLRLGLTAKLDLVSVAPGPNGEPEAVPVETKRGKVPQTPDRCYEPERVQLMAQGLLLREHGYRCDHGVLYFRGSRTRVDVPFTPELEARTLALIAQAREAAKSCTLPRPLDDSPKCPGCSLNAICLPDETLALQQAPPDPSAPNTRRLYSPRDDSLPFYVQEQGTSVGKIGETLVVRKQKDELGRARLKDISHVVLCGNIAITAQTVHLLCEAGIPIVHLSMGHWFYGVTHGINLRNAFDRAAQFSAAADTNRCLALAKELVAAKGLNQRTMLRRNASPPTSVLADMQDIVNRVPNALSLGELLGLEGNLAACYFRSFGGMLKPRDFDAHWDFESRNRRPPRDPVNAMLSFVYALLAKEFTVALLADGLDPWWGFYHQPRHGRPGLALDLMEPFRPLVADSAVITAINTGMVRSQDFVWAASGCAIKPAARKALIRAYEARLDQLVTHPVFDYQCSWRSMIRLHARLLSRWLRGDISRYTSIITR